MGYKCTPQIKGLIRGEPKMNKKSGKPQKHRANGRKICEELGNERYSKSETLDRTRSTLNEYGGFKSGGKCWDYMCSEADSHIIKSRTKNGKEFERHLPHNAVIGYSAILNPPAGMTAGWTKDDYERFYSDSMEALNHIEPRIFRKDTICMTAEHKDEGIPDADGNYSEHLHFAGIPKDAEGNYCGNLIDANLMDRINAGYPAFMREHGWDFDDLDRTDFSRMGKNEDGTYKDPAYRKERNEKRKKQGRSVNKFRADENAIHEMNIYLCEEMDVLRVSERLELDEQLADEAHEAYEQLNVELEAKQKKAQSELNANIGPRIRAVYNREQAAKAIEADLDKRAVEIIMYEDYLYTLTDDFNALSDEQKKTSRARSAKEKLDKTQAYIKAEKERQIRKAAATSDDAEEQKKRENDMQYY